MIVRGFIGPPDRQVRVIGEATDPIAIPYRDHMTLLDVMIATHGMTKYAAGNRADGGAGRSRRQAAKSIKVRLTDLIKYGEIRPEHRNESRRHPDHSAILVLRERSSHGFRTRLMLAQYLRAAWRRRWMGVIMSRGWCAALGWVVVYTIPNQFESGAARIFVDADAVLTPLAAGPWPRIQRTDHAA